MKGKWSVGHPLGAGRPAYVPAAEQREEVEAWARITHRSKACEGEDCGSCKDAECQDWCHHLIKE